MGEAELVSAIKKLFDKKAPGVTIGIGDDCAAISPGKGFELLVTTDTLTENVHFKRRWATAENIGYKTAAVNLSDIAAMGGTPRYLFLSLSLTNDIADRWIMAFLRGFKKAISPFDCNVVGGNIAKADTLSFTVTAIGEVAKGKIISRSGAKAGDVLYVTGTPGDAAFGLDILSGAIDGVRGKKSLIARHLTPTPRVEWALKLSSEKLASAMIDISDGVAIDLERVCEASGVGATINLTQFPFSPATARLVKQQGMKGYERVLSGGEDYELLFTVRPKNRDAVDQLIAKGAIEATAIGAITKSVDKKAQVRFLDIDGSPLKLLKSGWTHDRKDR